MFNAIKSILGINQNDDLPKYSDVQAEDAAKVKQEDDVKLNLTTPLKIVMILDESGSMQRIKNKMIDAINDFTKEQKEVKGRPATFTLVKFNHNINRVIENVDINETQIMGEDDYLPTGSTALYEAIGETTKWLGNERDVLMVIVTDGQDNASKTFNKSSISSIINQKEQHQNWSYVYLSCDLNTATQGDGMGFATSRTSSNKQVDQADFGAYISTNVCKAVSNYRTKNVSVQSQLN